MVKAKSENVQPAKPFGIRSNGGKGGRMKEGNWPPLEYPRSYLMNVIAEWVSEHRVSRRPLTIGVPLLAIVCALREGKYPCPVRRRLAIVLGSTPDGVDSAISTALGYGEIMEYYDVRPGFVEARKSVQRYRYLIPSEELFEVYMRAKQARARKRVAAAGIKIDDSVTLASVD